MPAEDERREEEEECRDKDAAARELAKTWAAARDGEWSEEWSKPQGGMLRAAMAHHGVAASEALMVGYDFVDQQAASLAGVDYVDQQHLFGVEMFDGGFDLQKMSTRLVHPDRAPGAQAPGSFAAEKRSKEFKKQDRVPRSPQAAGRGTSQ